MIELISININDATSIVGSRDRVRILAEDLSFNEMAATRLATITSELCRKLQKYSKQSSMTVGFEKGEYGFGLLLEFRPENSRFDTSHVEAFFDHCQWNEDGSSAVFSAFKYIPDSDFNPSEELIQDKKERLTRLSNAELMRALERKNKDLEDLLDELKIRAQREKELAAAAAIAEIERKESEKLAKAYKELEQVRKQEQHLANNDTVTGLPNRMYFQNHLSDSIKFAERNDQRVALLFIDLDHFKNVNDTVGHAEGDRLLRIVSERLLSCVRKSDTVARLGGDEFTVILLNVTNISVVESIATNIIKKLSGPYHLGGREFFIGASIGIAVFPEDGNNMELLIRNADTAMYKVKQSGRNDHRFYSEDMSLHTSERLDMENSLRKAIAQEELEVYYQPQLDCSTRRIISMEALCRWHHPDHGYISPDEFIPLAEEAGLIHEIGEWVLRTSCRQNRIWQAKGYTPIPVAVNLSIRQVEKGGLCELVADILKETGLAPEWLELELTEGIFLRDVKRATQVLSELRKTGIMIAIDDFGTGYSSLSQLRHLPIDTIKVDRSFIEGITRDKDDESIVSAIIALAHNLNLNAIAEGVETEAQLEFLGQHGYPQWQGFLFSKAVTAEEFELMLQQQTKKGCVSY